MKRAGVVLLAAVMAMFLARAQGDDKKAEKGSEAGDGLRKLDRTITDAIASGDTQTLDKHTSDDYLLIDPVGRCWRSFQAAG
jgi:hypothetical protein